MRREGAARGVIAIGLFLVLQVAWGAEPGVRFEPIEIPARLLHPQPVGFERLGPDRTGVNFTNRLSDEKAAENQIRLNGSGVALGDVDGDGWVDIYFCALENENRLFRNLGGMRFTDVTEDAGAGCPGQYSTGAALADVDGDGDLDLFVNGIGTGTRLFLNDGRGKFTEKTDAGLWNRFGATSLALADVDGDGDLDLYVANYGTTTIRTTGFALLNVRGKRMVRPEDRDRLELLPDGRVLEHGEPDAFYINQGGGKFARVSWTAGGFLDEEGRPLKQMPRDWGLSAMFRDINQDGLPDLYVCNDFHSPDRIWINTGAGAFQAIPKLALRSTSAFSMAVDFADIDRDGRDDFFVADMLDWYRRRRMVQFTGMEEVPSVPGMIDDRPQHARNTLQWNRGDGTYAELAYYAGVEASGWSWSAVFLDVDLDGYEDLLLTTGHLFDTQDMDAADRIRAAGPWKPSEIPKKLLMFPRLELPNAAFRNGGQRRFERNTNWGFTDVGVAHGMALGDLDRDGDLDVVVNNLNAAAGIYQNVTVRPRVAVRLRGRAPNTGGVGARIRLIQGDFEQAQEVIAGGRYLSCDDGVRTFAWRPGAGPARLEVRWRSGVVTRVDEVGPDQFYEISEPAPFEVVGAKETSNPPALFVDASGRLGHRHEESTFDDFQRQPLLPIRLSQLGPGVAWQDLDGDGWDDLVIGGSRGNRMAIYRNNRGKEFMAWPGSDQSKVLAQEQGGIVAAPLGEGTPVVLAALSNYENAGAVGSAVSEVSPGVGRERQEFPVLNWAARRTASAGPLALADYDGDGDLDLFVGGRCIPGRYPEAASSELWEREASGWRLDEENSRLLRNIGLVSSGVFSDLDGDGFPELILACEWGPVRVFKNERGRFGESTTALGLSEWRGLWSGIATADLDEDGRMDIIAANWGMNSPWRASPESPRKIYYDDFDENGTFDVLEVSYDGSGREAPERGLRALRAAMPGIMARFETYASYAAAGVVDLFLDAGSGPDKPRRPLRTVETTTLASTVFFNRGGRFEPRELPWPAQLAPAFAVVASDFNGDGHEDVFLSQNFFALPSALPRQDAGRGLLLLGDGRAGLRPASAIESGIAVYGEQRGAASADFNRDGRLDLVVTQNAATTCLYENVGGVPGLRISLRGPEGNPFGIGAAVRWRSEKGTGPWREIQSGSGYWSQNSSVLVLGVRAGAGELEVCWPGGKRTVSSIPRGAREVEIGLNGEVKVQ